MSRLALPPAPPPGDISKDVEPHNGRRQYRKKVPGLRNRIGGQRLLIWLVLNFQRIIAPVGRRFGKTTGLLFVIPELARTIRGMCYVGIWNSDHGKAKELMEVFITALGGDPKENKKSLIRKIHRADGQTRYIELHGVSGINDGTRIYFWSAVHPHYNRVRGFTHPFHLIVSDESSYIRANAILKVSLKMLADCGGKFLAIGTPDVEGVGFAWFSAFFARAMSDNPEWAEWGGMNFPSEANPTISMQNIATMRAECLSEEEEQQEIDAIFLEDTSGVFGVLTHVFDLDYMAQKPEWVDKLAEESGLTFGRYRAWVNDYARQGVYYVMGVDWARKTDKTVMVVFRQDTCREVMRVEIDGDDWDAQLKFVVGMRKAFGDCSIHSDANGVGDGMSRILTSRYGEHVVPQTWPGYTKERIVRTLSLLIRTRQIRLINCVDSREQFRLYHGERNEKTGRIRYAAPDGQHDDHVDATLLVAEALLTPMRPPQDGDGAEIEPDRPKPGTMGALRLEGGLGQDCPDRVDIMDAPLQI